MTTKGHKFCKWKGDIGSLLLHEFVWSFMVDVLPSTSTKNFDSIDSRALTGPSHLSPFQALMKSNR